MSENHPPHPPTPQPGSVSQSLVHLNCIGRGGKNIGKKKKMKNKIKFEKIYVADSLVPSKHTVH